MPLGHLDSIARALDAELVVTLRWRGGDLDRLIDEGHAALVGRCAEVLIARGWDVRPEVTYSVWGERGSIDFLAWHVQTSTLVVVEIKTELTSVEETLRRHDVKARLAAGIVLDRFGWQPRTVCRLLVLPDLATARRRVDRHEAVLLRSYPQRGADVRRWLRGPTGLMSGLMFVSLPHAKTGAHTAVSRRRVRGPCAPTGSRCSPAFGPGR
jgi:hypothetical protein